ncbi:nitrate- and nitrite sensing domain-containing protein [Streptomyces sp. YIM 98790]|uniref:sensor histidine kinase n=1 Tax=Streptomyces sp. YIM 98790 TaxID=2689077 RepID=UPI00140C9969|nr:nitrate- and nitrite sensing domain-containing protein [Streptomyces sp. YIM 98790]
MKVSALLRKPPTVRLRITGLVLVPLAGLLALWVYAVVGAAEQVGDARQEQAADAGVRTPVTAVVDALQSERRAAAAFLAEPDETHTRALGDAVTASRTAAARLLLPGGRTVADTAGLPALATSRMNALTAALDNLAALRDRVTSGGAPWPAAYRGYTSAIEAALRTESALDGGPQLRLAVELAWAGEHLARQDALLTAAAWSGEFAPDQREQFAAAAAARQALQLTATADLTGPPRDAWRELAGGGALAALAGAERRAAASGVTAAEEPGEDGGTGARGRREPDTGEVTGGEWEQAAAPVRQGLAEVEQALRESVRRSGPGGPLAALTRPAGAAALLGLALIGVTLALTVRAGRSLVRDLAGLRTAALDIARRKLPGAMRALRAGQPVDVSAEAPELPPAPDEIGQVHDALATLHRAALRATAERAELAGGIARAYVSLARRSQALVNRQLALIDEMERHTAEPAALDELFRLDHLTTRMRRQAESLIILSGAASGRSWSHPVVMTSVVQAAVGEIEDYRRVAVPVLPDAALAGHVVADLTHLLAELLENATRFSPPHTWVRVSGERTGSDTFGYALRIEDSGLGMPPAELERANRRIRRPDCLDLLETDRLGLFVVGRLAARHGVRVELRPAPGSGVAALVLLPAGLVAAPVEPGPVRSGTVPSA